MNYIQTQNNKQTGSALIVALSILLVLTILGISSLRTSSLEERMAGNTRDAQLAFAAAEAALREAEEFIIASPLDDAAAYTAAGLNGLHSSRAIINADAWTIETNWGNAAQVGYSNQVAIPPSYMIQKLESQSELGNSADLGRANAYGTTEEPPKFYQITARGTGISPNSRAMLQAYFNRISDTL